MLKSPLSLRWKRAEKIDPAAIRVHKNAKESGVAVYNGWVPSSSGVRGYMATVRLSDGVLTGAVCSCPDFNKKMYGLGVPLHNGVRVCKHTLALALKVH